MPRTKEEDMDEQPPASDPVLAALQGIAAQIQGISERVTALEAKPRMAPLATAVSPDARLRTMKPIKGDSSPVTATDVDDRRYRDYRPSYREGDLVRLRSGSEYEVHIRSRAPGLPADIIGVITQIGHVSKQRGFYKYKVKFPGLGTDGITEDQLELVEAA